MLTASFRIGRIKLSCSFQGILLSSLHTGLTPPRVLWWGTKSPFVAAQTYVYCPLVQESEKKLLSRTTLTSPPPYSAAHDSAARTEALKLAANVSTTTPANASDTQTHAQAHAQTLPQTHAQTDEEEEAKAPDLAKALAEILEFPEDLDGPNDPALLGVVSHDSSPGLQGMIASSSRLFRPEGRYPSFPPHPSYPPCAHHVPLCTPVTPTPKI